MPNNYDVSQTDKQIPLILRMLYCCQIYYLSNMNVYLDIKTTG